MDGNMEGMSWEEMVCAGLEDQKPPKKKKRIRKTQVISLSLPYYIVHLFIVL